MKINMPNDVVEIIGKLDSNGYEAYAVGGCIRDIMIGRVPNDWDITTSALPEEVKSLFSRTIDTGLQHGTVTVLMNQTPYEITTYRIDGEYEDNRRPKDVEFTKDLVKDLERRDFTINAMAYNDTDGLVDPFDGLKDVKARIIRCVGSAHERFNEDALRMLRAIRFSAQLGYKIDVATRKAIKYNSHLIKNVSAERIKVELEKTLTSKNPEKIQLLVKYNLIEKIIPEFIDIVDLDQKNPYHVYTVDEHTYKCLGAIDNKAVLRWTMYLHDIGKGRTRTIDEKGIGHFYGHQKVSCDLSRNILNRLKFDNHSKNIILKLIEFHDHRFELTSKNVRRAINKVGDDLFLDYLKVRKADVAGQNPEFYDKHIEDLNKIEEIFNQAMAENQCVKIKDLKLSGKDLISIGIPQGKMIGETLSQLLECVLENPSLNEYQWLMEKAKELNKVS